MPSQKKEKEQPVLEELTRPMELISIDLYELNGKQHLVTMDGYSGYVISQKLKNITTQDVINALEKTFQLFGYPERIRSDNGRQLVMPSPG